MQKAKKKEKRTLSVKAGQEIPKRILLADDNKAMRVVVAGLLEFIGYEVASAIDGVEALALFIENSFDLVLTDFEMPAMDGLSLAGHIKERSPGTPVILLTGSDRDAVLNMVERGTIDSVVFKPFKIEDLQREVQGALAFI